MSVSSYRYRIFVRNSKDLFIKANILPHLFVMSFSPSPTKSRGGYAGTPQHLKTLDILGKSKIFSKLSIDDLSLYCELARSKFNCESATDASVLFEDKYGWSIESRMHDIEQAWKFIDISVDSDDDDEQPEAKSNGTAVDSKHPLQSSSEIPIIIKAGALSRPVLICEVDDDDLHFTGDSGAVGRIFCDENSLRLDLKGRQYSGTLTAGPTLMILNLAAPVGQSSGAAVCARAEVITNEFCHLEFEKDLHSSLQGIYTGNEGDNELFERDSIAGSDYDGEGKKSRKSKKNSAKKTGITDGINPKISTITQRKRKSSTKSSSNSNTKKSASKKNKT